MSKRAERVRGIFAGLALFLAMGFCLCQNALAASSGAAKILVLPFQVHLADEPKNFASEFPSTLAQRVSSAGANVIAHSEMLRLVQSRRVSTLDIATVRSLASAAGARYAVYGSVNQVGGSVSIDARMVSTDRNEQPKPFFVEESAGAQGISNAVDELARSIAQEIPQPSGARVSGDAIAGIEVRGTQVLDPDVVLMRITTRKGDRPDAATIDQEVKRIWDLGYFSDVRVDLQQRASGTYIVYTVTEKPRVEHIAVEGCKEIDSDDVIAVMNTKSGSILNEGILAEDIQKILELYRKKGFYLAKVDQRTDMREGGRAAALIISVDEGKKLYISKVSVEGVSQLDPDDVKDQLLLSERSIISWITGTGVLKEELIERDSSAIASYYLDRGFMDVTVAAPKIDYAEDGIEVTFPIHEGPQYMLRNITFSGDLIDTDERLRSVTELDERAGKAEPFNLTAMQNDTKKLSEFYADYGYAFADVNPRPMKAEDGTQTVDIDFAIQKKNKVYVRRVLVEGNAKTRDNVILREMRLTDGEAFEGAKLRRSTERLNRLGYFEVAEAELVPTENDEEVDLKVKVKERPTGALMAGVGYSTFSNVGVSATIMERNLWGKGYHLSLQAAFSGRRDAYTLSFTNPRFYDTPLSVGVDAYHWRDDYIDYMKKTTGGVLRFSYPLGEYTSLGWGYRLDQYKIYDVDWDASEYIKRYDHGHRWTSVAMARIVRDSTDSDRPTKGHIDSLTVEYGGGVIGGDDDFVALTAEHQSYYQLWPGHVLHGRVKGQALLKNGSDDVPVFERFWMGGMNSVRGYDSRDIVPRDPKTGDRIGGTRMAFANLEYIWTLSDEFGLSLVPFFDVGFNIDTDHSYSWSDEILKSAGLEMRWRSPMGDLRFSYGIPFDEDRRGKRSDGRFEFSMGQTF